ncbi:MAG: protein kinase [Pyrinomonadaceae bacterium]
MLHCPQCGRQYSHGEKVCAIDQSPLQADPTIAVETPADPLIGRTFDGKYRLDEKLGVGGMGTVYRATHLLIDRPVAIKVLNSRFVEDEAALIRFRREARAAGRLQHANAVTVTDFGTTTDGYVYIVMELLEGRTLREVLAHDAPLDTARAVSLMMQISAAVGAAHAAGIIHRDLKPANIFIVQRPNTPATVKVLDFGIAKLAAEALEEDDHMTLTQVGVMIGTPRYMSPEQCDGVRLTPASDVYSLGIILYEMLAGMTPFTGSTPLAVAMKHSSSPPRPPSEIVATIPPAIESVVLHALEKNPADRPANADDFRQELYITAEQLGLEHSNILTAPSMETLRNAGTPTASGRLVLDLERLRQNRATTSGSTDLTVLNRDARDAPSLPSVNVGRQPGLGTGHEFPRVTVTVDGPAPGRPRKLGLLIGVLLLAIMVAVLAIVVSRSGGGAVNSANAVATPTPTPSPLATPSPTVVPAKATPRPAKEPPKKKQSKVGAAFSKFKRILKKPF